MNGHLRLASVNIRLLYKEASQASTVKVTMASGTRFCFGANVMQCLELNKQYVHFNHLDTNKHGVLLLLFFFLVHTVILW